MRLDGVRYLSDRDMLVSTWHSEVDMEITQELVRTLLDYDPETGHLYWRERPEEWYERRRLWMTWNTRFAGKRAGRVWINPKNGYRCRTIAVFGSVKKEHRIIWLYMKGDPVPDNIDHLDRDATNNKWANLAESTQARNSRNASMKRNNTSGVTGVSWNKRRGAWMAKVTLNGKSNYLGYFDDIDEAAEAVRTFKEANGFSSGHGMTTAPYPQHPGCTTG